MRLVFNIVFNTRPGQDVLLSLGGELLSMQYIFDGLWSCALDVPCGSEIGYRYQVREGDITMYEVGQERRIKVARDDGAMRILDSWQGMDDSAPFLTVPFTDVFNHHEEELPSVGKGGAVSLRVTVPNVTSDERILVCGSCPSLGGWDASRALPMQYAGSGRWMASFDCDSSFEYKFLRCSASEVEWESGENHRISPSMFDGCGWLLVEHSAAALSQRRPRLAGTAIPVFSLRSREGYGSGDFLDIKLMVDWACATGQKILQLLPVNDTTSTGTWTDSYPYSCISIMALHPIYINLPALGKIEDALLSAEIEDERRTLNALAQVDYERVLSLKCKYVETIFAQSGENTLRSREFKAFFESNRGWLLPYAAFCYLRDTCGTADFSKWGKYSVYDASLVDELWNSEPSAGAMRRSCFVQFHLDAQLREARSYAHSKGVVIKGDIPIGITPYSVEAWKEPYYFNMDSQAGAPPDFFSADGQNWGFPTYNWERMAQDGYLWWRRRFEKMGLYFDAYRIDHVLGFFRIWEIPRGFKSGIMGHFAPALPYSGEELVSRGFNLELFLEDPHKPGCYHPRIDSRGKGSPAMDALYDDFFFVRHNAFWKREASRKLPALMASTSMLTCAEDLGMIPSCVPGLLSELKILTLEIQRMPKDMNVALGDPSTFPYLSVCTTGSHDTSTLRGWWGENHGGEDALPEVCRWIIGQHLGAPSMLAIIPWQDWTAIDGALRAADTSVERINDPSNPRHYWRYRMHIALEDLIDDEDFNAAVCSMVHQSGR